ASGDRFRDGKHVKLQEQPFRLLVVLLENAGGVVTREELRDRIWPTDTFVDFDGSLRVAIRKLREALHDNADDPRYIETIPKRGYRFLVTEVRRVGAAHGPPLEAGAEAAMVAAAVPVDPERAKEARQPARRSSGWKDLGRGPKLGVALCAILVIAAALLL